MRVPDTLLHKTFMINLNRNKRTLSNIQTQLTTQSRVNKPSDNPLSNSRIMRMQDQLSGIFTYKSNISYAKSNIDDAILSMEGMEAEIQKIQVQMTQLNSAIVNEDLSSFSDSVDASLEILLDLANSDFNGSYNFGGTDSGTKPFYYDRTNNRVEANSEHLGGERIVKISSNIVQQYNITGMELFQSVYSQNGNLDSTLGVGVAQSTSSKVYDSEGNEYTLNLDYSKTADNTYDLEYTILDSDSNIIDNQTVSDLKFNSTTGNLESVDGDSLSQIHIQNTGNNIDFVIDLSELSEKDTTTNLTGSLNQKADIFNTLIALKATLDSGEKPSEDQVEMINDFHQHLLNKLSKSGGVSNKLTAAEEILLNKEFQISSLLSSEKDVDVAQALLDLESAQYTLDISYHISSMILPKSLLDYL